MKKGLIARELKEHLPLSLVMSLMAGVLVAILYLVNQEYFVGLVSGMFEVFHPAHVFVSAVATTVIYWKYRKSFVGAILVGVVGAIAIGTLSDVLFPWLSGNIFSLETALHLPIVEEPLLILGVALLGSLVGIKWDLFRSSHSLHVFLSVFASLFYLLTFSVEMSALGVLLGSALVFIAVYIPCCLSDIVFPLLFA